MKRFLSAILSAAMLVSSAIPIYAAEELSDDIVILYTNDVHTYIDGDLSYDVVSALKKDLKKQYKYVFLADAGDHIQGTAYGSMDKGENIIKMMNAAEYDVATLGNHEFDYGTEGCMQAMEWAEFPYISANFYNERDGVRTENVLDSFVLFDCGAEKLAFVGITTPETFEKSTSAYFQDENGTFIYGISGGKDGSALQQDVQNAIDEAAVQGATKIVALGHLGIDPSSEPWTSTETIAAVSGLDAFIDGHSHSTVESDTVADKDGNNVILTQTGSYFDRIGIMVIDAETDEITTDFIECEELSGKTRLSSDLYTGTEIISDTAVADIKEEWIREIDEKLGETIGSAAITLDNYDNDGNRLVRSEETNSGDFAADALYYLFDNMGMDVDAAIMNGGGIRNTAITGDISYKTCKDMHTFGNVACLQTVTGKQLLDALEWGARKLGVGENGGFLQVSGITYQIDTSIENGVKEDELGTWIEGPETYRVCDVKVYNKLTNEYEPLDVNAEYNLAGYNYTLRNLGDGYAMFDGAVNVLDYVMEDYMVIANYVKGFEHSTVDAENSPLKEKYPGMLINYGSINGSGRIQSAELADEVWAGGIKVTAENQNDVLNDGGSVKYDPHTGVLTLTDAHIKNPEGHGIYSRGVNLTINAEGECDISAENGCGIFAEGDEFGANANLTVSGNLGDITANGGCGIRAYCDITIKGNIGDINASGDLNSAVLSDFGNVIIEYNASCKNIISADYDGISAQNDIIVSGSIGDIYGGGYAGIRTTDGDVYIDGTVIGISGEFTGIDAYKSENHGGNIAIHGNAGKISGSVAGIYAEGNININGIAEICALSEDANEFALHAGEAIILPSDCNIVSEPQNYQITSHTDGNGTPYQTISADGVPAKSVKFSGFRFTDVNKSDWYYGNISYVTTTGLMSGVSETEFAPNKNLTRAMLVAVLYRAEHEPSADETDLFDDVPKDAYYAKAVCWARAVGIISGVTDSEFAPDVNITREQISAIMYRYAQSKGYDTAAGGMQIREFDDYESISSYALSAMGWAVNTGLIKGKTAVTINPSDYATRAETAAIINRFITSNN